MLKTIKNTILVDETQPLEQIKQQFKRRTYWFLGLSWFVSFLLIWAIPQDIMQYAWAKSFVGFVGYIVPMVDGLEHIRLYGSSDSHKAHLIVLSHISFYYAILWAYAWISVPYIMYLTKGNFVFNFDEKKPIDFKKIKIALKNNKKRYYLGFWFIITMVFFTYTNSDIGQHWFKIKYMHDYLGISAFISTPLITYIFTSFLYIHFLIKQQEKQSCH